MAKVDRAKLKRLLKELDSEKVRAAGKKAKGVGVAARAKAGEFVAERKRLRTPAARTAQAVAGRAKQVVRQESETVLRAEREQELEALQEASEAEAQRKRVEHEIFEQKYGEQIQQAKKLGRGVARGTAVAATALGKGLAGLGKGVSRELTHQEALTREARRASAERKALLQERRREDISSLFESEGVSPKEARRERQAGGDPFGIDVGEIDIGF